MKRPIDFSRRTLAAVRVLSREEADLFTRFCSFVVTLDGERVHIMPDGTIHTLQAAGLSFDPLMHFDSCGLIDYLPASPPHSTRVPGQTTAAMEYHGRVFDLEVSHVAVAQPRLIPLTSVGQQLARICGSTPDDDYVAACLQALQSWGYGVSPRT